MWQWLKQFYHRMGSPKTFYYLSGKMLPVCTGLSLLGLLVGMVWGLAFAPADYQQGNSFRIIYIHVPAAGLAMLIYASMAVSGVVWLVWKMKMADIVTQCCAPVGAVFTAIALLTGGIWGKPTWGTYWVWDARLTSMLILLFLYIGVIALGQSIPNLVARGKAMALLSIVGAVNLPIIKYSVEWWNTLHQPATFTMTEKPAMPSEMWLPLLVMMLSCYLFAAVLVMTSARSEVLFRERNKQWVQEEVSNVL